MTQAAASRIDRLKGESNDKIRKLTDWHILAEWKCSRIWHVSFKCVSISTSHKVKKTSKIHHNNFFLFQIYRKDKTTLVGRSYLRPGSLVQGVKNQP
jgi:hypothetical protein